MAICRDNYIAVAMTKTNAMDNEIQALRKTLAWMDLVMANLNECVFVVDKDWKIIFVNSALADLVGTMRILMLGKYAWNAIPITQEGKLLESMIKNRKIPIKNAELLNGVYKIDSFKVNRIMELSCSYMPKLNQVACVLTDTTLETNAITQLHKLSNAG
jgi:transcriptional regulator with PAS, ATPase and Fis domain